MSRCPRCGDDDTAEGPGPCSCGHRKGDGVKKHSVDVCRKGERYGEPGEVIETIERVLHAEQIGNFNPVFCRYRGKDWLVSSREGDLSDPFRRTESYLSELFIEVGQPEP